MALGKKKKKEREAAAKADRLPFYDPTRSLHRLLPCVFLTVGVLIGVFFALEVLGMGSPIGSWCVSFLIGMFGYSAYTIPALLLFIGIRWRSDIVHRRAISRCVYYALILIMAEAILWLFVTDKTLSYSFLRYYQNGMGVLGGSLAHLLFRTTSYIGVPLFATALLCMFFYHFLNLTPHKVLTYFRNKNNAEDEEDDFEEADAEEDEDNATKTTTPENNTEGQKKELTKEEKKALKRAEKDAKRAARKEARAATHESCDNDSYDGYFPAADGEESFGDIRRRMEREAREIERERAREEILSHNAVATPAVDTTDETTPVAPAVPVEEDYFPTYTAQSATVAPSPVSSAPQSVPAQSADVVFGAFDPLAGDAVINTTSTILRPAGASVETRRETVRPVTATRDSYHTVPGGVQDNGGGVGSFCIRPTPHKVPVTAPETTPVDTTEETVAETSSATAEHTLADFEMITRRTDNEIPTESTLPYVHPATQPSTQPQPAPQTPPAAPQGYPYPASPYGQPVYPAPPYPQGYPTNPYMPYPPTPYPGYPYPPMPAGSYPAPTPAAPVETAPPAAPAVPIGEIRIEQHTDVSREEAVDSTAHVVEHNIESTVTTTPVRQSASATTPAPAETTPKRTVPSYDNYHFPPVSLLERSVPVTNFNTEAETNDTSARLVNEFRKFKINIEVKDVTIGPRVTRYSIAPPDGVRINTLMGLANDIALGLAVKSIRIEPVPNTPYLGVEIPNRSATTVHLSSLIDTENFRSTKTVTTIPIGASVTGQPVFADIAKMPHVLIAGATGMGKSVFMNSLLLSLLYKARPDEVKLILVDPKRVELSVYNGIPHLIIPTVVEPQKAAGALIWAVGEMERRYHLMEKFGMRSIESYNNAVREDPSRGEVQPKIIIVIDELNDLMMQARDAVEPAIMSIAQKARAAGIYLIIGTQRPSVDVITGVIKANIPSRIAFHVSSGTDSRTILDAYGAEKLLNNGDMLASISGAEPIRVQGAFVADEEVERVTSFLKENAGPAVYDEIINAQIESETEKYKNSGKRQSDRDNDDEDLDGSIFEDSKFMEACNVALESGKISTSLLQRRCSIGYGKAAKYIDIMQSMGIVSAPDGQKPRDVLMSRDQFMEMVSRESYTDED